MLSLLLSSSSFVLAFRRPRFGLAAAIVTVAVLLLLYSVGRPQSGLYSWLIAFSRITDYMPSYQLQQLQQHTPLLQQRRRCSMRKVSYSEPNC